MTWATVPMPGTVQPDQVGREPLVLSQLVLDQQQLAAQRARVVHALQPDQRTFVRASAPGDLVACRPASVTCAPSGSSCRGRST